MSNTRCGARQDSENNKKKGTDVIIRELNARHHHYAPVARLPIIIANQGALARTALAVSDARHAEADVWGKVERCGIQDGDAVPAALDLDGQMLLEAVAGGRMVEDGLEWRILQRGAVDIARHPVVIKDGRADLVMVHVVGGAGDAGIVVARLPYELEEVVNAGEDVVHEDDGVEELVFGVAQLVQRDKGGVADLGEVLDAMIERATRPS
jgi:hypothetical protein